MTVEELLSKKKDILNDETKLEKKFDIISYVRLILFIGAVILLYVGISGRNLTFILLAVLLIIGFIVCIVLHSKIDEKMDDLKAKDEVITRFISRITGKWTGFQDTGSEFINETDTVVKDLDLVGPGSLYQMINIAHTFDGRKRLAESFAKRDVDTGNIAPRNESISELSENKDFLINLETVLIRMAGRKIRTSKWAENSLPEEMGTAYDDGAEKKTKSKGAVLIVVSVIILLINIAAVILEMSGGINVRYGAIIIALVIGNILSFIFSTKGDSTTVNLYNFGMRADDYTAILSAIAKEKFESKLLSQMNVDITKEDGIISGMKSLKTIAGMQSITFNPLLSFFLDGFFGWSNITTFFANKWYVRHSDMLSRTREIIAGYEELSSLAVLSVVRETSRPNITDGSVVSITAENAFHPLISPDTVIANDADIKDKVTIITGSNMSGKTTFLRTIAVNMVLAYMGANVCAKSFSLPYMRIFTSMRVSDDALSGISTFFAEILRIKEMAEYIRSNENGAPAACFIDEIFKGTNSADRIVGAEKALSRLSEGNALTVVSTHDFELCDIKDAGGNSAANYHFEEYYEGDEIKFDYTIKDGRCTTRNAMALLRMAGLS